jgi:LCP family protein required for cell wall assembly
MVRWRRRGADAPAGPRRTWPQRLVLAGGCATVLGLVASASGLAYVYRKYERLPRVELTGVLATEDDSGSAEPENYLVVGVDSAAGLDRDDPVRRGRDDLQRSDTIMVLRIDPESRQAALLSLPRDLWIPIPGSTSNQRINTMIERGGPGLLIRAIDEYLGIPIHHYVQVDFAAFQGLVEAVDGVPVYANHPARDEETGLVLDQGCVTLEPEQALAYVRSRHYEERIDGEWVEDPRSDLGRIQRQQDFIRRALSRAIDKGARNPSRLDELIDVALDGITVDDALTADDIFRLGNRFRSFEPEDLLTYSVPTVDDNVGAAEILRLVEDEAEPVLAVFRGASENDGSGLSPASVRLQVQNGSGMPGEASLAASELTAAGFGVSGTGEAPTFDNERTVVRYPAGERDAAELVARWLVADAVLQEVPGTGGTEGTGETESGPESDPDRGPESDLEPDPGTTSSSGIVVVTGRDWDGLRDDPRPADDGTSSTTGGLGTTTSSVPSSLTTQSTQPDGTADSGSDTGSDGSGGGDGSGTSSTTSTTVSPAARAC